MIEAQSFCTTSSPAQDSSRIASIGDWELVSNENRNNCCASGMDRMIGKIANL
jgi:hypothetical protein